MDLFFYNTLSRKKERFISIRPQMVSMYSCGPTVYDYAHIGNMRTYIFTDLLRRVLLYNGYGLQHVMNITDVGHLESDSDEGEDKMLKGSKEKNLSVWEIADYYTQAFIKDTQKLNIQRPEIIAKATDNIEEMIAFVSELMEKGYAYEISDGIYFDIEQFKDYGKLSRIDLEEQKAGARVEVNPEKRNASDFALWKKAPKEHIMQWESPWGMGYPGWHIECSAMGQKYLGDVFDIHTGGVDHIPVHHENEIAQSEARLGHPAVHYWMHSEFMMVNFGKMSKSLKNAYTLQDLEDKGILPMSFRFFCLNAHYRNKLNFTWEAIRSFDVSYKRFMKEAWEHKGKQMSRENASLDSYKNDFLHAINDDLNIPKALGICWNMIRQEEKSNQVFETLLEFDMILGLKIDEGLTEEPQKDVNSLDEEIKQIVFKRMEARKQKDYQKSDELRDLLLLKGYKMKDTKTGYELEKISNKDLS